MLSACLPGLRLVDKSPSSEYFEPLSEPELPVLDSKTFKEIINIIEQG